VDAVVEDRFMPTVFYRSRRFKATAAEKARTFEKPSI
jgi:hypothetical protein